RKTMEMKMPVFLLRYFLRQKFVYFFREFDRIYNNLCISISERLMQVAKWGNSLAVRLPATLVKELGLQVGDELKLKQAVRQKGQVSELLVAKVPSKLEILAGVRQLRTAIPKNFVFDRDEANAR
ncbi:MAG: AbrB/MazE/SpoVT family DNA-binding domain-containing protein, partial [Polynucleobacter sp.]